MEEITEDAKIAARVAALGIGKASLMACVRVPHEDEPGRRLQEVREFATTTAALLELRDWLICQGVKNVPGRPKTGRLDAVWLGKLAERAHRPVP